MNTQARRKPSIGTLIGNVIRAAQQQPERRPEIFGNAAVTFAGLAQDPRNGNTARLLRTAALEFQHAAKRPATISDFRDLLMETAEAHAEVGPDGDDTDLVARRRETHEARSGTHQVSIAPRSINEDTPLGRVGTFKWNPTHDEVANGVKATDTLAMWQGTKEEAQAVTVDAGIVRPANRTGEINGRPYGLVDFGCDGSKIQVRFDIGFGTRFTLPANFVSVLVGMGPPPDGRLSAELIIGVSIGMFAAPSLAPVFCTQYVDHLPSMGTSELIPRPIKSVQLFPPLSTQVSGSALYEFFDTSGIYAVGNVRINASTVGAPIPIPADAAFIKVTNTSGSLASFRLPFQLSL